MRKGRVVRAAVVQAGSVLYDTPATLEKLEKFVIAAKATGAELAVLPEAFIGGYPKGEQFGVSLGQRTDEGRESFRRYFDCAIEVPGPETEFIAEVARENQLALVVGAIERGGGTLYCSVLFFDATGTYFGKRRKVMPTALERAVWGCGDGSTLQVYDTACGRLGAVICWENYMPLLRTSMYQQDIELYCAPTVDDRDSWIPSMQHIAIEGRCFVLSACQYLASDQPENDDRPLIRGGSCIVSPFGQLLSGPIYGTEEVIVADLDLSEIAKGKFDLDVVGHYSRPDIFTLHVDRHGKA